MKGHKLWQHVVKSFSFQLWVLNVCYAWPPRLTFPARATNEPLPCEHPLVALPHEVGTTSDEKRHRCCHCRWGVVDDEQVQSLLQPAGSDALHELPGDENSWVRTPTLRRKLPIPTCGLWGVRRQCSAACRLTHDNPTEEVNRLGFLTPLTDLQDTPLPSRPKAVCKAHSSGLLKSASLGEPHPLQISTHPQLQGLQDSTAVRGHSELGQVYWGPPTVYDEPNEPRAYSHMFSAPSKSKLCQLCELQLAFCPQFASGMRAPWLGAPWRSCPSSSAAHDVA